MSGDFGRHNSKFLGHVLARSYQRWTQETRRCENPRCQTNSRVSCHDNEHDTSPIRSKPDLFLQYFRGGWARQTT